MRENTVRYLGIATIGLGLGGFILVSGGPIGSGSAHLAAATSHTTELPAASSSNAPIASSSPPTTTAPFTYRVGLLAGLSTDNYWNFYGSDPTAWNAYVLGPTKPSLLAIKYPEIEIVPDLATEVPRALWSPEGWSVEVGIKPGLKWSDGKRITAHDVEFTFKTVRSFKLGGSWSEAFPAVVTSVKAVDSNTVRIGFSAWPSLAVWPHGVGLAPIMPRHIWTNPVHFAADSSDPAASLYAASGLADVSGGPLDLVSHDDSTIRSVANPAYGDGGADIVEYRIFGSVEEAMEAVEAGDIDTILSPRGLPTHLVPDYTAANGVATLTSPANGFRYLGFNLKRDPMSIPEFRDALAILLDREAMADSLGDGAAGAHTMIPAANSLWYDEEKAGELAQPEMTAEARLTEAVRILRGAGFTWATEPSYTDGSPAPGVGLRIGGRPQPMLTIITPGDAYDPARPAYAAAIADSLKLLGFEAKPVITDFETVVSHAFTPDEKGDFRYDMYVLGWSLGSPALPQFHNWFFASNGHMNNTGYGNAEFDDLVRRYEQATTESQARDLLWRMEAILADDKPYLVLFDARIIEVYRSDRLRFPFQTSLGGIQGVLGGAERLIPTES